MTRKLIIPTYLTLDELEHRYRRATGSSARRQWQIVWLLAGGAATAKVARVTG